MAYGQFRTLSPIVAGIAGCVVVLLFSGCTSPSGMRGPAWPFEIGAGDGLGRSVFSHYISTQDSEARPTHMATLR